MGQPDTSAATATTSAATDVRDIEFIKAMLELAKEDARQVYVRVTAAAAIAAVFVTQIPIANLLALSEFTRIVMLVGLAAVALAGLSHFQYVQAIHLSRVKMAKCLVGLDTATVAQTWTDTWENKGIYHTLGHVLFAFGALALCWVLVDLFLIA